MIKINELRMGNMIWSYKNDNDNYLIVRETHPDSILASIYNGDNFQWSLGEIQINPIPLTEELLLRFGFEKESNYSFLKSGHKCWQDSTNNDWYFHFNDHDIYNRRKAYIKIKFVHQLQNLYFALTGVELVLMKP